VYEMLMWADENHGAEYKIVRVGEEEDDVECETDCYGNDADICLEDYVDLERCVRVSDGKLLD
jgi:hypothetical protein